MPDPTITITMTWKVSGDDTHFRPHKLVQAMRALLPSFIDRGQVEYRLQNSPDAVTKDPRPPGWDDYFVHPSYDIQFK